MSGALTRGSLRARRTTGRLAGRLGLGIALSTAATGFVLAVPVVSSGTPTSTAALDASSSSAAPSGEETSPVVMGRDGAAPRPVVDTPVVPPVAEVPAPVTEAPATSEMPEAAPVDAADTAAETAADTAPETAAGTPAGTPARSTAAATGAPAPGVEAAVIALVNTVRTGAGCAPVVHEEGLARVARAHSADMRDRDFFDHVNPDGLDPFQRAESAGQTDARAENIAYGQPNPAAVMDGWMNSSGHRANILDCELDTLGVGVAEGPGGPWWTQLFGD
jgi:uncharacterized protein YkwD